MQTGKAAALTASLLAKKGEAAPAVSATAFTNPDLAWQDSGNRKADPNWFRRPNGEVANTPYNGDENMDRYSESETVREMNPIRVTERPRPIPQPVVEAPPKPAPKAVPEAAPTPVKAAKPVAVVFKNDSRTEAPEAKDNTVVPKTVKVNGKRVAVTLRLEDDLYLRLKVFAAKTRRTNQDILKEALDRYIGANTAGPMSGCACLRQKG